MNAQTLVLRLITTAVSAQCSSRTITVDAGEPCSAQATSIDSVWQLSGMQHGLHAPTADTGLWGLPGLLRRRSAQLKQ
jgi:hypothetical protein